MTRLMISLALMLLVVASVDCQEPESSTDKLQKQSEQFQERIIPVADNVYTAIGFSVSNVSMIVGDEGVVIVDTGMSLDDAERIASEFRKLSDKPVKAIVLTHAHGDHTGGAAAFLGGTRPQIWAHKNFGSEARSWVNGRLTIQNVRGARQAGFRLPPSLRINNGIAPRPLPENVPGAS